MFSHNLFECLFADYASAVSGAWVDR